MEKNIKNKKTGGRLEIALITLSVVTLLVAFLFPLIIWDALGGGAMHFMQHGGVNVSGDTAGNSAATFFFGLDYFFTHSGAGTFIPMQLFSAQWRVLMGVTQASAAADGLAVITMILTVLIFVTAGLMLVMYALDRFTNIRLVRKIAKWFSAVVAGIGLITLIWWLIIIFGLMSHIKGDEFKFFDFMAYGGIKFILEAVLTAAMCALNTVLFIKLIRQPKENT